LCVVNCAGLTYNTNAKSGNAMLARVIAFKELVSSDLYSCSE